MTTSKTYRLVILPQVLRTVSPILLIQTIILFQDTSLVYVLSITTCSGRRRRWPSEMLGWSRCT